MWRIALGSLGYQDLVARWYTTNQSFVNSNLVFVPSHYPNATKHYHHDRISYLSSSNLYPVCDYITDVALVEAYESISKKNKKTGRFWTKNGALWIEGGSEWNRPAESRLLEHINT